MSWRLEMNRRRKDRLAKELQAVVRPSEGPAEPQPGVSSLNCAADVSTTGASAALFKQGERPKFARGEYPPAAELRALVAVGLNDDQIGKHYQRSAKWGFDARRSRGIPAARGPGGRRPEKLVLPAPRATDDPSADEIRACVDEGMSDPEIGEHFGRTKSWALYIRRKHGIETAIDQGCRRRPAPAAFGFVPSRWAITDEIERAFFGLHGGYQSFTERQIHKYERTFSATRAHRSTIDMAPILYGDPAPDRPRA